MTRGYFIETRRRPRVSAEPLKSAPTSGSMVGLVLPVGVALDGDLPGGNRSVYTGDTSPAVRLAVVDANGPVSTLDDAAGIAVQFVGYSATFGGVGVPIDPAVVDLDRVDVWNLSYPFAVNDTAVSGAYRVLVTITLTGGSNPDQVETLEAAGKLLIYPRPVTP